MRVDLTNVSRWKHQWGHHNRGVVWDTPLSEWSGPGTDWILKTKEVTIVYGGGV